MGKTLRYVNEIDIPTVNDWLEGWKLNRIPEGMYPETGLLLYDEESGEGIYAGFIWLSNSEMAQIGFITRNPNYKALNKNEQTRLNFITSLYLLAKDLGAKYVITWAESQFLINDFKELGFISSSNKVNELIKF